MHFPIIQLDIVPFKDMNYPQLDQDSVIETETDYVGDEYNSEERKNFIRNSLPDFFAGIATVDPEAETITLLDKDVIKQTIINHYKECFSVIEDKLDKVEFNDEAVWKVGHALRVYGKNYKRNWLFFLQGYTQTSMNFIEDYTYHPKVMYIGHIIDAHV